MAILDYSGILNRGVSGAGQTALNTQNQLQGLAMGQQRIKQNDMNISQQQQQQELQQANLQQAKQLDEQAQQIYQSGDANAIADFSIKNPERAKRILAAQGVIDADGKRRVSDRFSNIVTSQDPVTTLQNEIQKGESQGLDMTQSKQILAKNLPPEEIKKAAMVALASVDGDRFKSLNSASGESKPMTEYQREMIEGGNADREVRKLEVENKRIDNEIKRETNEVKLDDLRNKTQANKEKQIQIKKARSETAQSVVDSGASTLDIVNQIENHPGFDSAIGAKGASSLFGAFDEPISGTDAAGVAALIETLEAQNFLTAIGQFKSAGGAGALSDNEGKKLGAALTNLKRSQSEDDFRKSLGVIKGLVKKQVSRAKGQVSKEFYLEESTSNTNEASDDIDLSKLSLEELKAMRGKL